MAGTGNYPFVFRTPVGGCFAFDLQRTGPKDLLFCVRQLGRGPPRHRLASVKVSFGSANGACFQYPLSRALASDELIGDAALRAGTPPAVSRVAPAVLTPTLSPSPGTPERRPWQLVMSVTVRLARVSGGEGRPSVGRSRPSEERARHMSFI